MMFLLDFLWEYSMFGYIQFRNGSDNYRTPPEFQNAAREHVAAHLAQMRLQKQQNNQIHSHIHNHNHNQQKSNNKLQVIQEHPQVIQQQHSQIQHNKSQYINSPLRQATANANIVDSDEASSIDSGRSGCSLSADAAKSLLEAQQRSLEEAMDDRSLFSHVTVSTNATLLSNNSNTLPLSNVIPTDFTDYYSPDLDVARFSNGRPVFTKRPLKNWQINDVRSLLIYPQLRPEWNGKIPNVLSPSSSSSSSSKTLRIQIIPPHLPDPMIADYLAHSDIYEEAKFDESFRVQTAKFIVERARRRHKQMLIDSFDVQPEQFNENNLTGNIQYDCYFKFEWRNIIENFMLNLGIEYQCRIEFKLKMSKLAKHKSNNTTLQKAILNKKTITENDKLAIWKDIQANVHNSLNMDGWSV